jgi:hypothetical protein|tara:strand:- start:2648 stop:2977 length:330 start_codon:yes stop_codon:yes gene_type:complete
MSKHTEGKWFWIGETLRYKQDGDSLKTNGICWRGRILFHSNKSKEETQANRNLIASAPELLQEYKNVIGRVRRMAIAMRRHELGDWVNDWLNDDILDGKAIAKAEGGAK